MEITKENLLYRFTVVAWFILGVLFGGLTMRVVDMWEISKLKTQEEYLCATKELPIKQWEMVKKPFILKQTYNA
jgi:hypothetical protein